MTHQLRRDPIGAKFPPSARGLAGAKSQRAKRAALGGGAARVGVERSVIPMSPRGASRVNETLWDGSLGSFDEDDDSPTVNAASNGESTQPAALDEGLTALSGIGFDTSNAPPRRPRARQRAPLKSFVWVLAGVFVLAAQVGTVMSAVSMWQGGTGDSNEAEGAQHAGIVGSRDAREPWTSSVHAVGAAQRHSAFAATAPRSTVPDAVSAEDHASKSEQIAAAVERLAQPSALSFPQEGSNSDHSHYLTPGSPAELEATISNFDATPSGAPTGRAVGRDAALSADSLAPAPSSRVIPENAAGSMLASAHAASGETGVIGSGPGRGLSRSQPSAVPRPKPRPWSPSEAPGRARAVARKDTGARPSSLRRVPKPVPELTGRVGRLRDAAWVLEQPREHFTLQLVSITDGAQVRPFAKRLSVSAELAAFSRVKKGATSHVLVHGVYGDRQAADRASKQVGRSNKLKPWVRKLGDVHAEIRNPN